jgi:hypothetical protein
MGKITRFVEDVAIYDEDYVYYQDWLKQNDGGTEEEFFEWCDENELTGQSV